MKTAKQWAAEVVSDPCKEPGRSLWNVFLMRDDERAVCLEPQGSEECARSVSADALNIIERLVERAQADARAPLELLLLEVCEALAEVQRSAPEGSTSEYVCDRLLPMIEEALR